MDVYDVRCTYSLLQCAALADIITCQLVIYRDCRHGGVGSPLSESRYVNVGCLTRYTIETHLVSMWRGFT